VADTTNSGNEFHGLITLTEKQFLLSDGTGSLTTSDRSNASTAGQHEIKLDIA